MARTKHSNRLSTGKLRPTVQLAAKKAAAQTRPQPVRVKRKLANGVRALKEIRKYQNSTELLIRKAPFYRLIREITNDYKTDVRFQSSALEALQQAAEIYLVEILDKANRLAIHAKRVTVSVKDIRLALLFDTGFHREYDPVNGASGITPQVSEEAANRYKEARLKAKKVLLAKKKRKKGTTGPGKLRGTDKKMAGEEGEVLIDDVEEARSPESSLGSLVDDLIAGKISNVLHVPFF